MASPQRATERKARDIFSLALRERNANAEEKSTGDETTVLVAGSKQAGKSTIIHRFLDRSSEGPKPTLALEYTYGRKSRANDMGKDIVHIWELGGGTASIELMESVATVNSIETMKCVLVLDLSKPAELWGTLETMLGALKSRVERISSDLISKDSVVPQQLKKKAWESLGEEHPDKDTLDPIPIPIVIVGTKYDLFQDFEPEQRKVICKTLRFVAHMNGASILFASDKDEGMLSRCKRMFNALAFNGASSRSVVLDYDKPLIVPAGTDTLSQIGTPSLLNDELRKQGIRNPIDLWQAAYEQYFPPANGGDTQLPADPCADQTYVEQPVDDMRAQKSEELERYKRQADRRARELAIKHANKANKGSSKSGKPRKPSKPSKPDGNKSKSRRNFGSSAAKAEPVVTEIE